MSLMDSFTQGAKLGLETGERYGKFSSIRDAIKGVLDKYNQQQELTSVYGTKGIMDQAFQDPTEQRYKQALTRQAESNADFYESRKNGSGEEVVHYDQETGEVTTSDNPNAVAFLKIPGQRGSFRFTKISAPTTIFNPQSGTMETGGKSSVGGMRQLTPVTGEERGEYSTINTVESALNVMNEALESGQLDNAMNQIYMGRNIPDFAVPKEMKVLKSAYQLFSGTFPFMRGGKQLTVTEKDAIDAIANPFGKSPEQIKFALGTLRSEGTLRKLLMTEGRGAMQQPQVPQVNNEVAPGYSSDEWEVVE